MSEKKLFLLDGHALVYRAHYAFISRPLINSKGLNTSAIMGFTNVLRDLMKKENPTHLAVSFDLSGPTFRNEIFEDYKANRESQPEEITAAFPYIHEVIKGFKIPIITCKGYEADDVIGTAAILGHWRRRRIAKSVQSDRAAVAPENADDRGAT